MSTIVILGEGPLGRAVADAATEAGHEPRLIGRPATGRHGPATFDGADAVIDASRPDAVATNIEAALAAGIGRFVVATTAWDADRATVEARLVDVGAAAVASANFSLGVALFGRLVESAVALFGQVDAFDPYLVEWHRAAKHDRPSGTARDLARRIAAGHPRLTGPDDLEVVSIRAGASPGMHLVGFDASGETLEIRLTARDRSAYAAGILASLDWLERAPRPAGLHTFEPIVDELVARRPIADSPIAVPSAA